MKLIIDIPDKVYNRIRSDNGHCYCSLRDDDMHEVVLALCDGVVIPQGHGDLIDRDALIQKQFIPNVGFELVDLDDLKTAPTVIPADK